jgi:phosphoesterase RecJ-like protein
VTLPQAAPDGFEEVAAYLSSGRKFLLTGHRNPDGDSLGSCLALAIALRNAGKEAQVVMRDQWASSYDPLPGIETVAVAEALPAGWPASFDALIALECPDAERPGFPNLLAGTVLNVDHHPGNACYGALNLVDVKAAAAGEVVADLLDRLAWPITPEIATNIWVALVSDTGSFRYSNTTPKALALGARLVGAGVRPGEVNEFLFEAMPLSALRLETLVLETLTLHDAGRVATVELPRRFFDASGARSADTENLVNRARGIGGVVAAALIRESDEAGEFRCSLRSKGTVDVRAVASRYSGGGHRNASGCRIRGSAESVREELVALLSEAVAAGTSPAPEGAAG